MANYFRFLNVGKRPSLVDYALGLDNISMYGNRRREIGYNHMTRELIWGGFMVYYNIFQFSTNQVTKHKPFFVIGIVGFYIAFDKLSLRETQV